MERSLFSGRVKYGSPQLGRRHYTLCRTWSHRCLRWTHTGGRGTHRAPLATSRRRRRSSFSWLVLRVPNFCLCLSGYLYVRCRLLYLTGLLCWVPQNRPRVIFLRPRTQTKLFTWFHTGIRLGVKGVDTSLSPSSDLTTTVDHRVTGVCQCLLVRRGRTRSYHCGSRRGSGTIQIQNDDSDGLVLRLQLTIGYLHSCGRTPFRPRDKGTVTPSTCRPSRPVGRTGKGEVGRPENLC